jgi:hypothetical protein
MRKVLVLEEQAHGSERVRINSNSKGRRGDEGIPNRVGPKEWVTNQD